MQFNAPLNVIGLFLVLFLLAKMHYHVCTSIQLSRNYNCIVRSTIKDQTQVDKNLQNELGVHTSVDSSTRIFAKQRYRSRTSSVRTDDLQYRSCNSSRISATSRNITGGEGKAGRGEGGRSPGRSTGGRRGRGRGTVLEDGDVGEGVAARSGKGHIAGGWRCRGRGGGEVEEDGSGLAPSSAGMSETSSSSAVTATRLAPLRGGDAAAGLLL
jgi:hypothetical protein